jgi:ribonuclease P protein component
MRLKNRFGRNSRLRNREDFIRLFDCPEVFKARSLLVFSKTRDPDARQSRLGITIKGKISSVHRNSLKRIIRESFRKQRDTNPKDHNVLVKADTRQGAKTLLSSVGCDLQAWSKARSEQCQ